MPEQSTRRPTTWADVAMITVVCATLVAIIWIFAS